MKSNSGNDGSYGLTVSFELGTNPDINTVNVNNRVQAALAAAAAARCSGSGVTVQKQSSAMLQFLAVLQRGRQAGPAVHQQLRHHQRARPPVAHAGRRPGQPVRRAGLLHARLVRHQPADQPEPDAVGHHRRHPGAEHPGRRSGRIGAQPIARRPAVPDQHADPGAAGHAGAVRRHRPARQSGRLRAAHPRRGAGRAGRRQHGHREPPQRQPGGLDRHLSVARRECRADLARGCRQALDELSTRFPPGLHAAVFYDSTHLRRRHDPRGDQDAARGLRPGRDRGVPVPRQSARDASSRPSPCRSA